MQSLIPKLGIWSYEPEMHKHNLAWFDPEKFSVWFKPKTAKKIIHSLIVYAEQMFFFLLNVNETAVICERLLRIIYLQYFFWQRIQKNLNKSVANSPKCIAIGKWSNVWVTATDLTFVIKLSKTKISSFKQSWYKSKPYFSRIHRQRNAQKSCANFIVHEISNVFLFKSTDIVSKTCCLQLFNSYENMFYWLYLQMRKGLKSP